MVEADEQFLDRLRTDVEPLLRGWARLADLRLDRRPAGVGIVATLETPSGPTDVRYDGATVIDAAAGLPGRLGEARLTLAFRELVLPSRG